MSKRSSFVVCFVVFGFFVGLGILSIFLAPLSTMPTTPLHYFVSLGETFIFNAYFVVAINIATNIGVLLVYRFTKKNLFQYVLLPVTSLCFVGAIFNYIYWSWYYWPKLFEGEFFYVIIGITPFVEMLSILGMSTCSFIMHIFSTKKSKTDSNEEPAL